MSDSLIAVMPPEESSKNPAASTRPSDGDRIAREPGPGKDAWIHRKHSHSEAIEASDDVTLRQTES